MTREERNKDVHIDNTENIEERAREYREENYDKYEEISEYQLEDAYIKGAIEQRKIDIEKACEALFGLMFDGYADIPNVEEAKKYVRRVMEG